ncbi:t-SNARE [Morchella snyderi]|nr:t-SNARE [Morchella snyderi]
MSFDYLSRPIEVPPLSHGPNFDKDATSLSRKLTYINSEMSQILSLQEQVGGRRDSAELREKIHHKLRETGKKFEWTEVDVKLMQRWERGELSPSQQYTAENLSDTFSKLLARFHSLQRVLTENTTRPLPNAPSVCSSSEVLITMGPQMPPCESVLADQAEVELQKAMILERDQEILSLRQGVEDINDMLKALAAIVGMQRDDLVIIEDNVDGVASDIREADIELRHAIKLHKRARNRACCLLLTCTIVFAIVLLAGIQL